MVHSFLGIEGEKAEIPLDAFIFSDDQEAISEFELVFEHNKKVYKYVLHLCKTHVVREELYKKDETQFFNYIFKRALSNHHLLLICHKFYTVYHKVMFFRYKELKEPGSFHRCQSRIHHFLSCLFIHIHSFLSTAT